MYNHILYLLYWFFNSVIIFILSEAVNIREIRLGSSRFNSIESSIYAGFCLTFLIWVWWDFAIARKFNLKNEKTTTLFFLFVNCFSLWVMSRFSFITGFSVSSFLWLFILGVIVTAVQRVVWKVVVGR